MKSKGITIWEQHVEKMVLGVAVLLFAAFTAMQFIGNPNAAKMGTETVSPGEVDGKLETKAQSIVANQGPDARSPFELPAVDPVADKLRAALDDTLSPNGTLEIAQYNMVPKVGQDIMKPQPYNVPTINFPDPVLAKQYSDALLPEVVDMPEGEDLSEPVVKMHQTLLALFPEGKPYDLTYLTVAGQFSLAQLRSEFAKKVADAAQIPASWYSGEPKIVDVVIERGELVDGHLTNIVEIKPLPGQYSFRTPDFLESSSPLTANDRNYMVDELRKPIVERDIIQPEFLATRRGSWQPPLLEDLEEQVVDETMTEEQAEVARIDRIIRRTKAERDRVATRLEELGGPLTDGEMGGGKGGSGGSGTTGGGGGGKPGKGGGLQGVNDGNSQADERTKRIRKELAKKLEQLDRLIETKEAERAKLAGATTIEAVVDDGPKDTIMIWGHDIDVEAGKTYQYRMTVKVLNPFFGRKLSLIESQQKLADSITLESQPSPWSEPTYVAPPVRMFVTGATAASQGGIGNTSAFGQASIEVFRFYDGLTWSESFSVQPGDRVGSMREVTLRSPEGSKKFTVDFRTDFMVVDIIENYEAEPRAGVNTANLGARVVLMNVKTGEITEFRDPSSDRFSASREELKEEVDLSKEAALSS